MTADQTDVAMVLKLAGWTWLDVDDGILWGADPNGFYRKAPNLAAKPGDDDYSREALHWLNVAAWKLAVTNYAAYTDYATKQGELHAAARRDESPERNLRIYYADVLALVRFAAMVAALKEGKDAN